MSTAVRRSDKVRQRRARKTGYAPSKRRAPRRRAAAPSQPPVVVRGDALGGLAAQRGRSKRARRRVDIPLRSGADLVLPGIPIVHPGWRLLSAALSLLLGLTLFWAWNAAAYRVEGIELAEGIQRLTPEDVQLLIPLRGTPIFAVDAAMLTAQIKAGFPELAEPSVSVGLPAKIRIQAVERQPVLAWVQDGRATWVDMQGVGFPPRGTADSLVTVMAEAAPSSETGAPSGVSIPPETVEACLQVSHIAPEGVPLVYSQEHGLGWQDPLGWQVYFGHQLGDIEGKLRTYVAIVNYLQSNDIHPVLVSLEYPQAPYYRLTP